MNGRLLIDGIDVYATYGVYVGFGGWNGLVSMPPMKSVESNEWHEEDGVEADLTAPVLDAREVSVKFFVNTVNDRHLDFLAMLSDGAYHTFNCVYIGRSYQLRIVSTGEFSITNGLGSLTLKFADDFPTVNSGGQGPVVGLENADETWLLDGFPLSEYGVRILRGTFAEVTKLSNVKKNLLRNSKTNQGAEYDPSFVRFASKDAKLYCLMTAADLQKLWQNYDALLHDLIQPDERLLFNDTIKHGFPCYYKSCSVSEFYPEEAWVKFTITLCFTHDFYLRYMEALLASEADEYIVTEEDDETFISIYSR